MIPGYTNDLREKQVQAGYAKAIKDVVEALRGLLADPELHTRSVLHAADFIEDRFDKPPVYECNRCRAPKGKHALGESCNQNCGGKVVER